MKTFRKGDKVTRISNWDRKGAFVFRQAIVHSCGKVQMVLIDAKTGEVMGRHFSPNGADGTYPYMTDADAKVKAGELAAKFLDRERAKLRRLSETGARNGRGYVSAILRDLDELGEARGIDYHDDEVR